MKLKRLEIIGFKSFRDKVVLDFSPGISGIVGPNGCGKSNIADAIRWVMGEQRVKTLRGKKMDDVIFNGSEEASPVGMAEVSMILAADENKFPGNYADSSEVMITRRIFREAESEYTINKVSCRLLDVREFFMGTGIGARTYSLVEQNSVASLVEAKPEERRQFIEEAAGISKYKSRKEFALRKMEATQENILRVNDILREVKAQLNGLSRQAKRAEQYKALKQSLKDAELKVALQTCFELNEVRIAREEERIALQDKITGLRTRLLSLETAREELKTDVMEQEALIFALQEKLYATRNVISSKEQAIEYSRRKIADLSSKRIKDIEQITALKRKAEVSGDEIAALRNAAQEAERILDSLRKETAAAAGALEELRRMDQTCRQAIETRKGRYVDLAAEKARIKNTLIGLVRMDEDLKKREEREISEIETNKKKSEELQRMRERITAGLSADQAKHAELLEQKEELTATIEDARRELVQADAKIAALREGYSGKSTRLSSLKEFAENYEGCNEGVKSLLAGDPKKDNPDSFRGSFMGLVADVINVPKEYETAVEALLGEKLQYMVVKNQEEGIQAIEYLKGASLGRGSFAPLEIRPGRPREAHADYVHLQETFPLIDLITIREDCRPIINELLGDTLVIPNLQDGVNIWRQNGFRGTFVTAEGDVISPGGILSGGSASGKERSLLGNRREISELSDEVTQLQTSLQGNQEKREKITALIAQTDEGLLRLRSETHLTELRINGLGKDRERYDSELGHIEERLQALVFNRETIAADAAETKKKISLYEGEMTALVEKETQLREAMAAEQQRADSVRDQREECERSMTEKKVRLATLEGKYNADKQTLSRLEKSVVDNDGEIAARLADANSCEQEERELTQKIETEKGTLQGLYGENETIALNLSQKRDLQQEKEALLRSRETEIHETKKDLDTQLRDEAALDIALRETQMQSENLRQNMEEKHGVDLVALLPQFPPLNDEEIADAATALARERRAIDNFGEVNLLALSEHEELKTRFEFLTAQITDLNASLEALKQTISRINTITRQRFSETFDGINGCFQEVFSRLFPGGRAKLKMTDENNLLETGVDIEIRIPGKFTQNVTLLSGGEKSLSAIALIFSILIYRPVPFILLDEADAALDDTNISLFNRLVKDTAAHSQILMITHNKKSMEISDSLYGVTIRKKGVSSLVSVSLT
ncbi:MAG: chromosome segregation protein SMC [Syntrophales bacterium]